MPSAEARLAELRRLRVPASEVEAHFRDLVMLAATICGAPAAAISFIDADRQWFLAEIGLGLRETPLEMSICRHAVSRSGMLIVPDIATDPRFEGIALRVAGQPVRFYGGAVLETEAGFRLGAVCVFDREPRPEGLSPEQMEALAALSRAVVKQLELLAANRRLLELRRAQEAEASGGDREKLVQQRLKESEERYRALVEATAATVWQTDAAGAEAAPPTPPSYFRHAGNNWAAVVHPDDRPASQAAWQKALENATPLDVIERKLTTCGEYRWTHVRAQPLKHPDGSVREWVGAITDIHDRVTSEKALQASEERYRLVARATADAIWDWNLQTNRISWGEAALALFRCERDELESDVDQWLQRVHPDDRDSVVELLGEFIATGGQRWTCEYRIRRGDGSYALVLDRGYAICDENGRPVRIVGALQDITERLRAQEAIRASEERLRLALRASRMVAYERDLVTGFVQRSENAMELLGIGSGSVDDFLMRVHPDDRHLAREFLDASARRDSSAAEMRYVAPGGRELWLGLRAEKPSPNRLIGIAFDITDRKAAEEEIWRTANHDPLTGLPNRALFQKRLEEALQAAEANGASVSLLLIDLDEFKDVNDSLGHDAGDALLRITAERLKSMLGEGDDVARIGGDEFAMILVGPMTLECTAKVADEVVERLRAPFDYDGRTLSTRASIGVAAYPHHHREAAELMKDADIALYRAKAAGRTCAMLYTQAAREETQRRIQITRDVRAGLEEEQFLPFYQPKICLSTGRIVGFEALARWRHPVAGILTPGYFGSAFGDAEVAVVLGEKIVRRVAEDIGSWLQAGFDCGHVAVNLCSAQFADPDLAEHVLRVLADHGVPASRIEVEVTETVLLGRSAETILSTLTKFHESGVKIALDDFGTGFASLSHLKQFPVDHIKIDQSFVRDLVANREDAAIVAAILGLSRNLGIDATAEGVETAEQAQRLREMGCDYAQGYFFDRPEAGSRIPWLLRNWTGEMTDRFPEVARGRLAVGRGG